MKQWIKKITLVSAVVLGASTSLNSWAEDSSIKLGYVDMQKAIQSTTEGKKAKEQLETEFKKKKSELEKKEEELRKIKEDFDKKQLVLSDEVKTKKENDMRMEFAKYQELLSKSQLEIQKKERDLTVPIVKKLREILDEIGKKENFTMVFEKSEQSVLYAKKELDLTDRLVKEFEANQKKETKTKK